MTRPYYSLFFINSAQHQCRHLAGDRVTQFAVSQVETTPGVKRWSFIDDPVPFMHGGKEREAHLPIAVAFKRGPRQLWQVLPGYDGELERAAIAAGQEYAAAQQCEHVLLTDRGFRERPVETLNRRAAHALLDHASEWHSTEHQARAVVAVRAASMPLGKLAELLKLRWEQVQVVFIRAWLDELVQWDVSRLRLTPEFLVEARRD
jgi:hypothetical protein